MRHEATGGRRVLTNSPGNSIGLTLASAFMDRLAADPGASCRLAVAMRPPKAVIPPGLNHVSKPLDVIAKSTGLLKLGGRSCD